MTGYTRELSEGKDISFKEFAMKCSRAFGAMIHMRDNDLDSEITRPEPSDYHLKEKKSAENELMRFNGMRKETILIELQKALEEENAELKDEIDKINASRATCEKLMRECIEWNAPTEEHKGVKDFMFEQLQGFLDIDCDTRYYEERIKNNNKPIDIDEYIQTYIKDLEDDIKRHCKKHSEEVARVRKRCKWIDEFEESL